MRGELVSHLSSRPPAPWQGCLVSVPSQGTPHGQGCCATAPLWLCHLLSLEQDLAQDPSKALGLWRCSTPTPPR